MFTTTNKNLFGNAQGITDSRGKIFKHTKIVGWLTNRGPFGGSTPFDKRQRAIFFDTFRDD